MNKSFFLLKSLAIVFLLVSCSNDDNSNGNNDSNSVNYFPLTIGNYWNYDVENTNLENNQTQQRRDSLYVASANTNNYTSAVNGIANGTMNSILTQTTLERTSNILLGTGAVIFPFDGLDDLVISFFDAPFYNANTASGAMLYENTDTIEQTVESLPITATYTFKTTQGDFFETTTLNNMIYNNVTSAAIDIELTITTTVEVIPGSFVDITILAPQNIMHIDNYYVENIGLVRSEADISFQLEDYSQIGVTLPFPSSLNATSTQELDTYEVADE